MTDVSNDTESSVHMAQVNSEQMEEWGIKGHFFSDWPESFNKE